jgi:formylglycine-generating enzyme required for sulfatase activity
MKRLSLVMALVSVVALEGRALPATLRVIDRCPPDEVLVGQTCIDTWEASVWSIPVPTSANRGLVTRVRRGTATLADLVTGGAVQLGVAADDYPCSAAGSDCRNMIFAVSLPGVVPSTHITWFQAQQACGSAAKRLPGNGEWQQAVAGTPDPGPDNGVTDCNTAAAAAVNTGSRVACASAYGAVDMVGNVGEWVADWGSASTTCPHWGSFSDDDMCFAGASTTATGPAALVRGGSFGIPYLPSSGPLAINGFNLPQDRSAKIGFRCAR